MGVWGPRTVENTSSVQSAEIRECVAQRPAFLKRRPQRMNFRSVAKARGCERGGIVVFLVRICIVVRLSVDFRNFCKLSLV